MGAAQQRDWLGGMGESERGGVGGARATKTGQPCSRDTGALVRFGEGSKYYACADGRLPSGWWGGTEAGPVRERGGEFRPLAYGTTSNAQSPRFWPLGENAKWL